MAGLVLRGIHALLHPLGRPLWQPGMAQAGIPARRLGMVRLDGAADPVVLPEFEVVGSAWAVEVVAQRDLTDHPVHPIPLS